MSAVLSTLGRGENIQKCPECGGVLSLSPDKKLGRCIECNHHVRNPIVVTVSSHTDEKFTVTKDGKEFIYNSIDELPDGLKELYSIEDEIKLLLRDAKLVSMGIKVGFKEDQPFFLVEGRQYNTIADVPDYAKPLIRLAIKHHRVSRELGQEYQKVTREITDHVTKMGEDSINQYTDGLTPRDVPDTFLKKCRKEYVESGMKNTMFDYCPKCKGEVETKTSFFGRGICMVCKSKTIVVRASGNMLTISER